MMFKKLVALPVVTAVVAISSLADAGQWRNGGSEYKIGKLDTFLYEPSTAPALGGKRALMVSMHGCAQPNNDFFAGAGWPPIADQYGMVVALPQAAGEGMYGSMMQCWNFHVGMSASRNSSDAKYLIELVNELLADATLNIDPKQVYLTGLSSGAGMTNTMGCLAPDIFAGVGVNAGPAPGSGGTDLSTPGISVSKGKSNCFELANKDGFNNQQHLYTQLHNDVHGTDDGSVSPQHAHRNADIAVAVYSDNDNINECGTAQISGARSGNHGDLTEWCGSDGKGRVSKILVNGMGHAWPAGNNSSGGGSYIDHDHINYPEWIAKWFFDNNMRVQVEENEDQDNDGVIDANDNCPAVPNSDQQDSNQNGVGDACESAVTDTDQDGVDDASDNCPFDYNPGQEDSDGDGEGDNCDAVDDVDADGDGILNDDDNCPNRYNYSQKDSDNNGVGDACDNGGEGADTDGDQHVDEQDNCPLDYNPSQTDTDGDGLGDVCDSDEERVDYDGDRIPDDVDNCPTKANTNQSDVDEDGLGDACDPKDDRVQDADSDGVADAQDNCPNNSNANQSDVDGDGVGDVCDARDDRVQDADNDGVEDSADNCPNNANANQSDVDSDGIGDVCDPVDDRPVEEECTGLFCGIIGGGTIGGGFGGWFGS